jgi:hypothetical protein
MQTIHRAVSLLPKNPSPSLLFPFFSTHCIDSLFQFPIVHLFNQWISRGMLSRHLLYQEAAEGYPAYLPDSLNNQ